METAVLEKKSMTENRHSKKTASNQNFGLNQAQIHFLEMLQYIKTDEMLEELKEIVRNYYIQKVQAEADRLWDEGVLGDFLLKEHLRTPYK